MRWLLLPLRILALALVIATGLVVTPLAFPWMHQTSRNRLLRLWARAVLAICGTRLRVTGSVPTGTLAHTGVAAAGAGRLLLANHISWLDVYAINAALPCRFVAKAEIGAWPVVGKLVTWTGTLYIERGRRHAVAATNQRIRARLAAGESVAVFPEGTTSDGIGLLPFHSNLIAAALEMGAPIWPVALRYTEAGAPSTVAAYVGDLTLVGSLLRVLRARQLEVELHFAAPLAAHSAANRHELAQAARAQIAAHLGLAAVAPGRATDGGPVSPGPESTPADTRPESTAGSASAVR